MTRAGFYVRTYGYGMASVRFICGTLDLHRTLEREIAQFIGTDDAITFAACFDANGGVFEPLLDVEDAIVSDSLNHASIIDGVRLCKAKRYRFASRDLADLEHQLQQARADGARHVLVVTDGVFSMDGYVADLVGICELADRHEALVMVDDCHATGFIGPGGRGTPALHGVADRGQAEHRRPVASASASVSLLERARTGAARRSASGAAPGRGRRRTPRATRREHGTLPGVDDRCRLHALR